MPRQSCLLLQEDLFSLPLPWTGEITVLGKVLPVGGIKEKVLAAYRMGIYDIVLCERNRKDVGEIPDGISRKMSFHYVSEFHEVLQYALSK